MSLLNVNNVSNCPVFQAPWPQSVSADLSKDKILLDKVKAVFFKGVQLLIGFVFLPLTVLALGVMNGVKTLVYPSPLTTYLNESERKEFKEILKAQFGGESVSLKSPEGHTIDGMIVRGEQKKAIIYCVGWNSYFEFKKRFDMLHDITKRVGDIHLMLFNPRGVGESEGNASSEGSALDLYSTFKYLTEVEGIDPSDIVIYGHSLGASYGASGAKLIQEEYPDAEINFFSERSFDDYAENVRQLVFDHLSNWPNLAKALGSFAAKTIRACKWGGDEADEAVSTLKGKICIAYNKIDEAVPFVGSFYQKMKERIAQGQPFAHPIRCVKLFEPEVSPAANDYSPHTRYLTPWEKQEIANELKAMLGIESEDPINIRRVKELGVQRPKADRDFDVALHAVNRLYAHLVQTEVVNEKILDCATMMFSGLETEKLLLRHFREQEAALNRIDNLLDPSPEGNKRFYLSVLARTRTMLILEQLEKNLREHRGVYETDRQLLQMLEEGIPISFEPSALNHFVNPLDWLYAETYRIYQQYRQNGVAWPVPQSPDLGRLGLRGEVFFPNSVRLEALQSLQRHLKEG